MKRMPSIHYQRGIDMVCKHGKPFIHRHRGKWYAFKLTSIVMPLRYGRCHDVSIAWLDAHASNFCRKLNSESPS